MADLIANGESGAAVRAKINKIGRPQRIISARNNLLYNSLTNGSATSATYRRIYELPNYTIIDPSFCFANWYAQGGPVPGGSYTSFEVDGPNDITVKAAITVGTVSGGNRMVPIRFNGQPSVTIPPGGSIWSDPLGLELDPSLIPFIELKIYVSCAPGGQWPLGRTSAATLGEGTNIAASGAAADLTGTPGAIPSATITAGYAPIAMRGTAQPGNVSVAIEGDSIGRGSGEGTLDNRDLGFIERALTSTPYINLARDGERFTNFLLSHEKTIGAIGPHVTSVICQSGVNDIYDGVYGSTAGNLAQIQGALTRKWNIFALRGISVFQTTITPVTTGTFTSQAGQTISTGNALRVAVNDWIRTVPAPLSGYFEIADIVESGRNSGKWKDSYTTDGTHPITSTHILMSAGIDITQLK